MVLLGKPREKFLLLPLRSFVGYADPDAIVSQDWVTQLPSARNLELASATILFAHK
jgi:hypothetical protein